MAFNTKIDSAGLTTLAGLGVLAFMAKKDKDKDKEKDKAGEEIVKTAEPVVKQPEHTKTHEPINNNNTPPQTKKKGKRKTKKKKKKKTKIKKKTKKTKKKKNKNTQ